MYLLVAAIYFVWALIEFVNLYIIYDKFLQADRITVKKSCFLWIPLIMIISWIFGLQYSGLMYQKQIALLIFAPYYLKTLPLLWEFFHFRKKDVFIVIFYQLFVATIAQGVLSFLDIYQKNTFYDLFYSDICVIGISLLIGVFLGILLFCRKNNILKVCFGELSVGQYLLFSITLFIANMIDAEVILIYSQDRLIKALSGINVAVVCVLIAQIILVQESGTRKGMIIEILDEQVKKSTEYYNKVIENETQTKKFRHDIKNLLLVLKSLVEKGKKEEALEYIEKMNDIRKDYIQQYDTGNFVADVILSTKAGVAEQQQTKITMVGYIPNEFENVDMVILLSNILDNAIEACAELEGEKEIVVESVLQKHLWSLCVQNPTSKDIVIQKNRIATTKPNREIHGYGIQNMERVVQKYDGNLKLEYEKKVFSVKALLRLST